MNIGAILETREKLVRAAAEASLVLAEHLNLLLDAYDWYIERYPVETLSQELELKDLSVSICALEIIPQHVTAALRNWDVGAESTLSTLGFEISVINEFNLHMCSLASFMRRKGVELEHFHDLEVGKAFGSLAQINRAIAEIKAV